MRVRVEALSNPNANTFPCNEIFSTPAFCCFFKRTASSTNASICSEVKSVSVKQSFPFKASNVVSKWTKDILVIPSFLYQDMLSCWIKHFSNQINRFLDLCFRNDQWRQ